VREQINRNIVRPATISTLRNTIMDLVLPFHTETEKINSCTNKICRIFELKKIIKKVYMELFND
jgi:hypothetical protein